nr:uncharacterized protein LOC127487370 isoform X10 [Oryctolagus cuniculus]
MYSGGLQVADSGLVWSVYSRGLQVADSGLVWSMYSGGLQVADSGLVWSMYSGGLQVADSGLVWSMYSGGLQVADSGLVWSMYSGDSRWQILGLSGVCIQGTPGGRFRACLECVFRGLQVEDSGLVWSVYSGDSRWQILGLSRVCIQGDTRWKILGVSGVCIQGDSRWQILDLSGVCIQGDSRWKILDLSGVCIQGDSRWQILDLALAVAVAAPVSPAFSPVKTFLSFRLWVSSSLGPMLRQDVRASPGSSHGASHQPCQPGFCPLCVDLSCQATFSLIWVLKFIKKKKEREGWLLISLLSCSGKAAVLLLEHIVFLNEQSTKFILHLSSLW